MNALGLLVAWTAAQVTLFCLAGAAVYLAARSIHRSWGAPALCGILLIAAGITALAFSPWPRWWTLADARLSEASPPTLQRAGTATTDEEPSGIVPSAAEPVAGGPAVQAIVGMPRFVSGLWADVHQHVADGFRETPGDGRWHWPAWLALAVLVGIAIGLARVLLGWLALTRLLRATRRIDEAAIVDVLDRFRRQLRCARNIELREMSRCDAGGSPAIIGWRRPVILLPADWRRWTEPERQAILAHETAHVAHGDFPMWLASQLAVVVHFYNPLVHWLACRLRLEQELAADACGAALAGGPKTYALTLARLALAQDNSRRLWAGRPFFSLRGTLMRRIEMLQRQPSGERRSPSRLWRAALLSALVCCGIGLSGVRGPMRVAEAGEAVTVKDTAETKREAAGNGVRPIFDESYLPANAFAVMSARPLKVAESATLVHPCLTSFPTTLGFGFSTTGNGVDEVRIIGLAPAADGKSPSEPSDPLEPAVVEIYRMNKPYERSKLRTMIFGQAPDGVTETACLGYPCFRAPPDLNGHPVNYLMVDDRTVIVVRDRDVPRVLAADTHSHPTWYEQWRKIADSPLAFACDSAAMAAFEGKPTDAQEAFILSVLQQTAFVFGHVECASGEVNVGVKANCTSPESALATSGIVQKGAADLIRALAEITQNLDTAAMPKEFQPLDIARTLVRALEDLKMDRQENTIDLKIKFDAAFVARLAEATKGLLARQSEEIEAREKQDAQAHLAKLSRLAAAFQAYQAEHGHYPPAAVVGPDGKTLHSWRVELLPYLGEQSLFNEYRLNEPWDSEHNKPLVEKMPSVYSTSQWCDKGEAEYFVVTGKGTLFDASTTGDHQPISDAPGETILVLESRQRVPWTRPVDIETTPDHNPTRPFRGHGKGFYAAFADGTVKFVSKETDAATVRALFTKAGGEEVKLR